MDTEFWSALHLKQINPLMKITLANQFLQKMEKETLKLHVSFLTMPFHPQHLRYKTFILRLPCLKNSKEAHLNCCGPLWGWPSKLDNYN